MAENDECEGISEVRGAKNRSTAHEDAADSLLGHLLGAFGPDQAVKSVTDADDAHVLGNRGAYLGANHRVQPRRIASAVNNAYRADRFHFSSMVILKIVLETEYP